jgi:Uma2 family endonuclease
MTTAAATHEHATNGARALPAQHEPPIEHVVFRAVNWTFYEGMLALVGDRRYRLTYDRGNLEITAPAWNHEWWSRRIDRILTGVSMALNVDFVGGGSTTFRRKDLDRGLEPDQCYYTLNAHRMLGLRELELSVDPPPDLALEVDSTHSSLDRMGIYAALGVTEVWRWDEGGMRVYHLQRSGEQSRYVVADHSLSFPAVPVDRIVDFIFATQSHADLRLIWAAHDWAKSGFPPATPPAEAAPSP